MGYTLPNLQVLMMSENQFEGQIPASIANASNLDTVFLANNSFSGVIPSFGSLQNLESLMLYLNQLEAGDWSFLSALTNCTHLTRLNLAGNNIRGDLPSSIANLSINLEVLALGSNHITGTLPSEIGNLVNLSLLYLGQNMLTGHIPSSLGHLRNLFVLSLFRNKFFGEIPPSIGNLDKLTELYLQENDLSGNIPKDLAGCRNLLALNLSSNALNGSIPTQLFGSLNQLSWFLDVSHNQLTHSIPLEIGGLINLGFLNISHNKLSGTIPSTLDACVRLESLRIEGNLLEGSIPQSLVNLKGVKEADFSQNNLSGEIPEFFESFTALQYLNLSFNDFEGQVPTGGVFAANASRVFVQGNPWLCAKYPMLQLPLCPTSRSKRKHKFLVPIVATVSIVAALAFLLVLFFLAVNVCKKRRSKANHLFHQSRMEFRKLSYGDLSKATNGFSSTNLVGSGRFGMVYKGKLDAEANSVAVKVFKLDHLGVSSSFITECKALRSTRHRNLVKVITACSTIDPMGNDFKALIFEYMANGSLESRLHTKIQSYGHLSLGTRICTAVDIASALDYLHNRCIPPVIHCDLKPNNVLFDDGNVACVCDFGLARFIHGSSSGGYNSSTSLVGPRGSVGYIAPEYGMGSKISAEGDVYSYGIVLLEMFTRKRPTEELFKDGLTLHGFVEASFPQIGEVLDPDLIAEMSGGHAGDTSEVEEYHTAARMQSCVVQLLRLGLLCSQESPKDRPMIQDIYREVTAIKEAFFSA